jgi:hypothetical protein
MDASVESRGNRAEEIRTERRKKPGEPGALPGLKLSVPKDKLDPRYEHRWVNDTGNRVNEMYEQDYDPVDLSSKGPNEGEGTLAKRVVSKDTGARAVLMRKPKAMYAEDQKEKRKPLDEMDAAIRRGVAHEKSGESDLKGEIAYTPGTNTINRI